MIVVIEGADLVGKSTLASRLAAEHGWPIVKIRWDLVGDPMVETTAMARATVGILEALQPNAIFDRSFLSWWAYGPVLGHDVAYMPRLAAQLTRLRDLRIVLMTASLRELTRRFTSAPDAWFDLATILAANERIPGIAGILPSSVPLVSVDTTSSGADEVYRQVRAFLQL